MKKAVVLAASVALATAAATGCSSSKDAGGGQNTSSAGGASTGVASSSATEQKLSFTANNPFVAKVDRKGQTILVGVTNDEKGSFTDPPERVAIEAAIRQINANGGINGAQIKEDLCLTDGTPDGAINCANKLVSDHVAMVTSGLNIAAEAAVPIIAGAKIPWISNQTYTQHPNDYVWQMGVPTSAFGLYSELAMKQVGSKKPAYLPSDDSTHQAQAKQFTQWGKQIDGVSPLVGPAQSATNPDWSTAIQTVQTQGADSLVFFVNEQSCTAVATSANQLGFKGPLLTTCIDYLKGLPRSATSNTYFEASAYSPSSVSQAPAQMKTNMENYVTAMKAVGGEKYTVGAAEFNYGTTQNIATILRTISAPQITSASVQEAVRQDRNMPSYDGPDFNCGAHVWPAVPNACTAYILVTKNTYQNDQLVQTIIKQSNYGWFADTALAAKSTEIK